MQIVDLQQALEAMLLSKAEVEDSVERVSSENSRLSSELMELRRTKIVTQPEVNLLKSHSSPLHFTIADDRMLSSADRPQRRGIKSVQTIGSQLNSYPEPSLSSVTTTRQVIVASDDAKGIEMDGTRSSTAAALQQLPTSSLQSPTLQQQSNGRRGVFRRIGVAALEPQNQSDIAVVYTSPY